MKTRSLKSNESQDCLIFFAAELIDRNKEKKRKEERKQKANPYFTLFCKGHIVIKG